MLYGKSPFLHENAGMMYGKIMEEEPSFVKDVKYSDDSIDLMKRLLKKNGTDRIGYDDEQEIFTHPWFNDIDFAKLIAKKLPAVVIPHVDESPGQKETVSTSVSGQDSGSQLTKTVIDLSFDIEDQNRKKPQQVNQKNLNPSPTGKMNESYEDFSYFEEEDHVETAVLHDDDNILDEEFEEERRVQLLTNIEECSDENLDTKDALDSPRNEEELNKSTKQPDLESKFIKRKISVDNIEANKALEKMDRKGSDTKNGSNGNNVKRQDSMDIKTSTSPFQPKRELQFKQPSSLDLPALNATTMEEISPEKQ